MDEMQFFVYDNYGVHLLVWNDNETGARWMAESNSKNIVFQARLVLE